MARAHGRGRGETARASRVRLSARRLRAAWSQRAVRVACPIVATLMLWPPAALVHHVYFDRSELPELAPFVLFQPPTTGEVTDARGEVVIQLAREYRRLVTYDEVPLVVRHAILAAEDKNFHEHSGVDYGALPRVIQKTAARTLSEWWNGSGLRLRLAQGGSTITQQLVRVYFLGYLTARRDDDALFVRGLTLARLMSAVLGAPATNKLLRKVEELRLSLWLEEAMLRQYGTREQAKREIFARYASFIYMGSGRYGFVAASEYYFDKPLAAYTIADAGRAALLAGIGKSPREYAPAPGRPGPLRRRNQILALMARNGYISEELARRCQAEPISAVRAATGEDRGARGDRARARRAAAVGRRALHGRGPVPGPDTRQVHDRPAGADDRQPGPGERARSLRETASRAPVGSSRARWWCWPTQTRRSWPSRGGGSFTTFVKPATRTTTA